jgi:DNA-directed RNA polymerase subunit omega
LSLSVSGRKQTAKQGKIMARITVEDCLERVDNRFGLIHLSAKRVRQLRKGVEPLVDCKNKDVVVSLREIAAGKIFQTEKIEEDLLIQNGEDPATKKIPEQTPEISPEQEQGEQETTTEGK